MPPDKLRKKLTLDWMRFAENDLIAAERVLGDDDRLLDFSCFHSQQAAEKAIKAFLICNDVQFGKTHDLVALGSLCPSGNDELKVVISEVEQLTRYAVDARYPGEDGNEATREEALDALRRARQLFEELAKIIRQTLGN